MMIYIVGLVLLIVASGLTLHYATLECREDSWQRSVNYWIKRDIREVQQYSHDPMTLL